MASKMLRAQVTGPDKPLAVNETEIYATPSKGLLVKTAFAGLCHTDLHLIISDAIMAKRIELLGDKYIGLTPGHEASGIIVGFGSEAKPEDFDLKKGDRVCIFPWIGCETCANCLNGDSHVCEENRLSTTELGLGENPGGFATYVPVLHCKYAVKVPDSVPMDIACMLPCSAVTALNALNKTKTYIERSLAARKHARLLISGAGGVGLWAIQIAKTMYKEKNVTIAAADIGQDKLDIAKEFGADEMVLWDPSKKGVENINITTNGGKEKLDAIVDFVNNPMTVEIAIGSLRNAGTIVLCGLFGGFYNLPLPMMIAKSISIQGSRVASLALLKEMVSMAEKVRFSYPSLEFYSLGDVNTAIDRMKERKIKGRALIKF